MTTDKKKTNEKLAKENARLADELDSWKREAARFRKQATVEGERAMAYKYSSEDIMARCHKLENIGYVCWAIIAVMAVMLMAWMLSC